VTLAVLVGSADCGARERLGVGLGVAVRVGLGVAVRVGVGVGDEVGDAVVHSGGTQVGSAAAVPGRRRVAAVRASSAPTRIRIG